MAPSDRNDLDFNTVLDRIIEFSEKNLSTQNEFLSKVYEIRNRFDNAERDHRDISQDTKVIITGVNNIFDKMKITPNEDLLAILEELKAYKQTIITELKSIASTRPACEAYHKDNASIERKVDLLAENLKLVTDAFEMIKKVLGVLSLLLVAIQIGIGIYFSVQKQAESKDVVDAVIKEINKQNVEIHK